MGPSLRGDVLLILKRTFLAAGHVKPTRPIPHLGDPAGDRRAILEILLQREKLGSTAVGNGVAIPHGKLPKLGRLFGLFARLQRSIDFEALDGQPVDLIFLLLAPEAAGADHLKALARVARLLRDPEIARKLRDSRDADALYAVLAMPAASSAA